VLKCIGDPKTATEVDLKDIRIVPKLGGTIDDTEMVDGLVLTQNVSRAAGGPTRVENAKIGLIQFCLSAPKTDMESNIQVRDYQQMDRLLREERTIIAKMVKQIKATGCNVLLIQKSILRDATTDLSLDYLAKAKILVIRDIEREEVDFISRTVGIEPVASLDAFTPDKFGECKTVYEDSLGDGSSRVVRMLGLKTQGACISVLVRGSNQLLLDETERSLHDALCVVRSLVKTKALLPGGGAPEMEVSQKLAQYAATLGGVSAICIRAYAEALEVIPYTLAENAGLKPVEIVTVLRASHAKDAPGSCYNGINVKKGSITNMVEEEVVQPLLVTLSLLKMATETVRMILKIDDVVMTR